ncbi:hypothetical protein [Streptomyces sp. NPDC059850]|uniref:hypothetical protein n=1 Tax=Streptomyces sp. NPDC059850 TaxID=3346970 RepID=UPI00364CFCE7
MQIAKKAAFLAATAGSLVLLGTGTAAAHGGTDHEAPPPANVQSCSVTTGDISFTNGDVTTGNVGDDSPVANNTVIISVSCFNTTETTEAA